MSLSPSKSMEYRLDLIDPTELESGGMTISEMADYHRQLNEYGRKKTVKSEMFESMIDEYEPDDMYVYFRLFTNRFAHPDRALGIGKAILRESIAEAFYDGDEDSAQAIYDDYGGSYTRGVREEGLGDGTDDMYATELYEELLKIEAVSGEGSMVRRIADTLERVAEPWVFVRALKSDEGYYVGEYMFIDGMTSHTDYTNDQLRRAWGIQNDAPLVFLDWAWDDREVQTECQPHTMIGEMKAKKADAEKAAELQDSSQDWIAQTKYDGARLFLHHSGDGDYRAYMAGNSDVTAQLPELFEEPLASQLPDHPFVIDGEVTPYDPDTGEVLPFQHILKRTGRDPDEMVGAGTGGVEARFKWFDVLNWQGHDISSHPYTERLDILKSAFTPDLVARTGTDMEVVFNKSIENGHEGVVLKRMDAPFEFDKRSSEWLKWKADPMEADLRISDAHEGAGRAADGVGALELQARFERGWVDVGSVGTGFSNHDRERLWAQYNAGELVGKTVQVNFEELQVSDDGTEAALRFPSFDALRPEGEPDSLERLARIAEVEDELAL